MPEDDRLILQRTERCNTDRLYGPIDEAIEYLKEVKARHPEAQLDEHWTGYEDMEIRFVWFGLETDQEYYSRRSLEREKSQREEQERLRKKHAEDTETRRQIAELQKKLSKS